MANPYAGEVDLVVDGRQRVMRLTLGALAELESGLHADSLIALVERFETGAFCARDVLLVLLAGLRGGGWHECSAATLAAAQIGGGPIAAARAAAELIVRAFSLPGESG